MKMDKMDKLISIGKVATILNQTTKQLQRWDNDGTFVAIKSVAGTRYYNMDDVLSMKKLLNGVTRKVASVELGVSEKTLWRWHNSGKLPYRYVIGSTAYYHKSDLEQYNKETRE